MGDPTRGTKRRLMVRALPAGLLALWLTAELMSLLPALPARPADASLQAMLAATVAPGQLLFHAAGALIAGRALVEIVGAAKSLFWLLVLAGAIAAGYAFAATGAALVSALCGLVLGCVGWWRLARWHAPRQGMALVLLVFAAYALGALWPFGIRDAPASFNLVPFAVLLDGSMLANLRVLAADLLLYAGILGVLRMNLMSPVPGSVALAILVALFETAHMLIGTRVPDITEPLLVLIMGQLFRLAPASAAAVPVRSRDNSGSRAGHVPPPVQPGSRPATVAAPQAAFDAPRRAATPAGSVARPVHGLVILAYMALIAYASFYPLSGWQMPAQPVWSFLIAPWPSHFSRADLVSNVLAYVPLGVLLGWRLRSRGGLAASVFTATLIGTLLSLSIEIAQTFLPARTPSNIDLLNNTVGTLIGAGLAGLFRGDTRVFRALFSLRNEWLLPGRLVSLGFAAIVFWILTQWSPFVPSIDLGGIRQGLAPIRRTLLDPSLLRPYETAAYALNILGLGLLLATLLKPGRPLLAPFSAAVIFVLLVKPFIVSRQLSMEAFGGLVLGVLALVPLRMLPRSVTLYVAAICLLAGFTAAELSPGIGAIAPFNWLPFAGALENNINGFANILAGVWPFLALGCLASLATPAHRRLEVGIAGTLAVMAFSFLMEWAQHYLPGRHGDVTTVLLAMGGWIVPWWWREPRARIPRRLV